jgi:hypothetical protein
MADEARKPDFGPGAFTEKVAKCGATNVGARGFLVAVNFNLNTTSTRRAMAVAFDVREKGRKAREGGSLTGKLLKDENGNQLFVNLSDTEGYEGWGVSLVPADGEAVGWIIQQEGNALRGNLNAWDETVEPFNVSITEEGQDGLKLEVEGGETYHFTPMDVPEASIVVTANIEGRGHIAYAEGEETPEIDPEFPAQSAYIGLAEPAVHTFTAEPEAGSLFVKWTKNGEDFST